MKAFEVEIRCTLPPTIWWIRRDLRLDDNHALQLALDHGSALIPVFILDPHLLRHAAPKRLAFLFDGLRSLGRELLAHSSCLVIRQGDPVEELSLLMAESGAVRIFSEEDTSPYALRRDSAVRARLPLELVTGATVFPPASVTKTNGDPYKVFTPYSKAWHALPFPGKPSTRLPSAFPPAPVLDSLPIPDPPALAAFPAGEAEARRRLDAFLSGPIHQYAVNRDRLDLNGTSELSPYLRFGMISSRRVAWWARESAANLADEEAKGSRTWLNELVWREFYASILVHFPNVLHAAFNPSLRDIPWRSDPAGLHAWQQGLTGFPVVDACMSQLRDLGWMHNRGRMITASFLVKDLLINWQEGERWFMQNLVDSDPASNNGGWQWTAGVGTDAAPYFRILNPISQSQKCDPYGHFIRHWVPELAHVPLAYIHTPWLMPPDVQLLTGCQIGRDYPAPILDHAEVKLRTIAVFKQSARHYQSVD